MSFALISIVCLWSIMPGPSTMLILGEAWSNGRRAGFMTALGGSLGALLYVGLTLLFDVVVSGEGGWMYALQFIGAAYLALLGLASIVQGLRNKEEHSVKEVDITNRFGSTGKGLLLYCLSPQTAIFYLAFLPQSEFTGMSWQTAVLLIGAGHALLRLGWYSGLIRATEPLQALVNGSLLQRGMKHATGTLFLLISAGMIW